MAAINRKTWFYAALLGAGAAGLAIALVQRRLRALERASSDDRVSEASEDSFPTSDPPSYTPTLGPRPMR